MKTSTVLIAISVLALQSYVLKVNLMNPNLDLKIKQTNVSEWHSSLKKGFRNEFKGCYTIAENKEYIDLTPNPYHAAEHGCIDEVIYTTDTGRKVIKALATLEHKVVPRIDRKHGNIPL